MQKNKTRNGLLSLILSLCLMVGMLPLNGMVLVAETVTDVWDGSTATGFAGGIGSESEPYQIATGAQLAYLQKQVRSGTTFEGNYFKLTDVYKRQVQLTLLIKMMKYYILCWIMQKTMP